MYYLQLNHLQHHKIITELKKKKTAKSSMKDSKSMVARCQGQGQGDIYSLLSLPAQNYWPLFLHCNGSRK